MTCRSSRHEVARPLCCLPAMDQRGLRGRRPQLRGGDGVRAPASSISLTLVRSCAIFNCASIRGSRSSLLVSRGEEGRRLDGPERHVQHRRLRGQGLDLVDMTETNGKSGLPAQVRQPSESPAGVDLAAAGGEVSYAGSATALAPPSPGSVDSSERYTLAMESGRRGGCAGCTTARSDRRSGLEAFAALLAASCIFAIRRRNRRGLDRPTPQSE